MDEPEDELGPMFHQYYILRVFWNTMELGRAYFSHPQKYVCNEMPAHHLVNFLIGSWNNSHVKIKKR